MTPLTPAPPDAFRLLLASERWAVHTFFISLRRRGLPTLVVEPIPGEPARIPDEASALARASAVAVDVAVDAHRAVELCDALRSVVPDLPLIALVCCAHSVNPWQLQQLLSAEVSVLDLQATPEEAVRALESVARGASVLNLHLRRGHRELLRDVLAGRDEIRTARASLLELVSQGLPDHEIGRRLHLSPHTVKHHIEALRRDIGARNRIELAAWAGRHGFYARDGERSETVPVQVARRGR